MSPFVRALWATAVLAGASLASAAEAQIVTNYSYDTHDQVVSVTRSSTTVGYSYDAAGNRTQLSVGAAQALAAKPGALSATNAQTSSAVDDLVVAHEAALAQLKAEIARRLGEPGAPSKVPVKTTP